MRCPRLLKTFYAEGEKMLLYRRILVYIIFAAWKSSNNPLIGKIVFIPLYILAAKNRSNKFGRFRVSSNQFILFLS